MVLLAAAAPCIDKAALESQLDGAQKSYERFLSNYTGPPGGLAGLQLFERIKDDRHELEDVPPSGFPEGDWQLTLESRVALDTSLVGELDAPPSTLALEPGLHDQIVRSRVDGVLDAVATYVPAVAPRSVAVVLHGTPQTEAELLASPYLTRLADTTSTVLVAPFGRGSYDFQGAARDDLYALITALRSMPQFQSLPFYLVGYSMGGFATYIVGPKAPVDWSGVLDVSGALRGSVSAAVLARWRHTRIYVVHGERDAVIPVGFARNSALFLFQSGVPVSYFEQPGGGHGLYQLVPALASAWRDMLRGTVDQSNVVRLVQPDQIDVSGGSSASEVRQKLP